MVSGHRAFISGLEVHYSDNDISPNESIPEIRTNSSDINQGFGGEYVWLIPHYTIDPNDACTFLEVQVTGHAREDLNDLAAGAGGHYRYVVAKKDKESHLKIQEVVLYRKNNDEGPFNERDMALIQGRSYTDWSADINHDRGKDYLYLIWKRAPVF